MAASLSAASILCVFYTVVATKSEAVYENIPRSHQGITRSRNEARWPLSTTTTLVIIMD